MGAPLTWLAGSTYKFSFFRYRQRKVKPFMFSPEKRATSKFTKIIISITKDGLKISLFYKKHFNCACKEKIKQIYNGNISNNRINIRVIY